MEENFQPLEVNFQKEKKQMGNLSDSIPRGITRHSYLVNSPTSFIKIMLS